MTAFDDLPVATPTNTVGAFDDLPEAAAPVTPTPPAPSTIPPVAPITATNADDLGAQTDIPLQQVAAKAFTTPPRAPAPVDTAGGQPTSFADLPDAGDVKEFAGQVIQGIKDFPSAVGTGLDTAAGLARAGVEDVAATSSLVKSSPDDNSFGGNVEAYLDNKPLPAEVAIRSVAADNPFATTLAKISEGLAGIIPTIPLFDGLPAVAKRAVSAAFGLYAATQVPGAVSALHDEYAKPSDQQDANRETDLWASILQNTGMAALAGYGAGRRGVVQDVPSLLKFLTKNVVESYPPDALRQTFNDVTTGNATPDQQNLYRFITSNVSAGQAARSGVDITTANVPRLDYDAVTKYLGIPDQTKTVSISGEPAAPEVAQPAPIVQPPLQLNQGVPDEIPQPKTEGSVPSEPEVSDKREVAVVKPQPEGNVQAEGGDAVKAGIVPTNVEPQGGTVITPPDVPGVAAAKTVPQSNWKVAVQAPVGSVPGFVQIIDPSATEQSQSPTVESLRAAGNDVPDFSKLPQGSYTYDQAVKLATQPPVEAAPPAPVVAAKEPWQMTKREFQDNPVGVKVGKRTAYYSGVGGSEAAKINSIIDAAHMKAVNTAVKLGKDVPLEAAAEYPEILSRLEKQKPAAEVLAFYKNAAAKARSDADAIQHRWDHPDPDGVAPIFQRVKFLQKKASALEAKVAELEKPVESAPSAVAQRSPMMEQYQRIKDQLNKEGHTNALLALRLGDFYEFFFNDAKIASQKANITLTSRNGVDMAGLPYHAANSYFQKLIAAGHQVAVVDTDPALLKTGKPVERKVTEIIGEKSSSPQQLKVGDKVVHQGEVKTVTRAVPGVDTIGIGKRAVPVSELQPAPTPVTPKAPTTPQASHLVLNGNKAVKVTSIPKGATMLRVTTNYKGRDIGENISKSDIEKSNIFYDTGVTKVEAGTIGTSGTAKGRFLPIKGDVIIEPKVKAQAVASLGDGLTKGSGMKSADVISSIKGADTAGFKVNVVSKDEAAAITGIPEARGYGGFFYDGKIYLVSDNISPGNPDGLIKLLNEEVGHGLLRTKEGVQQLQQIIDAAKLNLTDAEKKVLTDKGYTEDQLLDEFIAKSAAENLPWWKKILDQIRAWLSKFGLAKLSNSEIARLLIKNIRRAVTGNDDLSAEEFQTEPAVPSIAPGEPIKPDENPRAQVAGVEAIGQRRPTENIEEITKSIRSTLFDGQKPVSKDVTDKAWDIFSQMTDPTTKAGVAQRIKNDLGGSRIALSLYKGELLNYGLKLAVSGDQSLFRAMLDHSEDFETLAGGGASTAGSALRGEAEFANTPALRSLSDIFTTERERAGEKGSGLNQETFLKLVDQLGNLDLTPEDVESVINEGKTTDGKTIEDIVEEQSEASREAKSILDKYQRSQTEWLKPDVKKNIVRVIVDAALGENKLAKFGEADFKSRLSQRLQDVSVPKEISDELAHEVWKDKATREATKTDKAIKASESFEQSRAQSILDKLQSDQVEQFGEARRSKAADLIKAFYRNPVTAAGQAAEIQKLETDLIHADVKPATAKELAHEAGQRKRVLEANERTRVEKVTKDLAQDTAEKKLVELQNRHSDVEWLKDPAKKNAITSIITEMLKSNLPVGANRLANIREFTTRLTAAGVDLQTAENLALEIETERTTTFANKRAAAIEKAAGSKNIRSLVESILTMPYRAQSDPDWLNSTAVRWFESNGLAKDQAQVAAKLFSKQFEAAFQAAREKIGNAVLAKENPNTHDDLMKLIRLGQDWLDKLAENHGWKKPTPEQFKRLSDLQEKWSDPELSPPEKNAVMEQMNGILRHLGNHDKSWLLALGETQAASLLSGLRTISLHLFQPITSMLVKDLPTIALSRPQDLPMLVKNLLEAGKNFFPELKFAWQKDAFGFNEAKMYGFHSELKRQFEIGVEEWKKGNYKGALRLVYAWQQYVFRALQTANQAGMAVKREFAMSLYGSQIMRDAGFNTKQIAELSNVVPSMKEAAYNDGVERLGLDDNTARVRADYIVAEQLQDFFSNKVGDNLAAQAARAAELDAYSTTGFKAPGISEKDEGWLSNKLPINKFLNFMQDLRKEGGFNSVLGITGFGFVNVPLRMARFNANFFGYGILRWGVYKYRMARGLDTPWKQSFANETQAKQRLIEGIVGSLIGFGFLGWAWNNSTADDNSKKKFFIYATGHGATNKTLKDAWTKEGYRPFSLVIGLNGKVIASIPITRVGGALAWPLGLSAAEDDRAWARKDAQANGHAFNESVAGDLAQMAGTYYEIIGAQGIFQGISHLQQLAEGGGGMAKVLASSVSGVLSSIIMPGKQLLAGISQMLYGNPDRSSIESAIAANFPILGLPWFQPQINSLGDKLGDNTWYGKISNIGLPIAFRVSDNPVNRELYQTLLDKGVAPPDLRRTSIEQKYGQMTDDQFAQFATTTGDATKQAIVNNLDSIQEMTSPDAKKFILKAAQTAEAQAASGMGLVKQAKPTSSVAGAAAAPNPKSGGSHAASRSSTPHLRSPARLHLPKLGKVPHAMSALSHRSRSAFGAKRSHHAMT